MTRRSMPSSFHANLFALEPARCPFSTYGVVPAGTWGRSFCAGTWGHSLSMVWSNGVRLLCTKLAAPLSGRGVSGAFFWAYNGYWLAAVKVCPLRSFFLRLKEYVCPLRS